MVPTSSIADRAGDLSPAQFSLERFLPYGMVAPAVVVAFAIAVVPLVYGIWLSFQDWYMLRQPTPVFGGFINYAALFNDGAFWAAFVRTWVWTIGTVLAALVNFFNPHRIVLTGGVAQAGVPLIAGIREAVYRRSMPLAARSLEITVSDAPDLSGRLGAALMAIEGFLAEDAVDQVVAR